jgi:hypothetical protein
MATTIMFLTSESLLTKVIQWFTKGRVSHVAVSGFIVNGKEMCLTSDIKGVRFLSREEVLSDSTLVSEWRVEAVDLEEGMARAASKIGCGYDFVGLLGLGVVECARWIGIRFNNPFRSDNRFFCSELAMQLSRRIPEWNGLDSETVSPNDLLSICEHCTSGSFQKV